MSTIKVNNLESSTGGGVAAKLTSVNGGRIGTHNLVVNGAMQIAQRALSSTDNGYGSVDRFRTVYSGTDEAPTQSQGDVASGTTPYSLGFRKTFKITNGNQTSGAGSADRISFDHKIEAQDIANSGWNYTSTSSYITLSYWVKSSVSQNFFVRVLSKDGTNQRYAFETGTLTANTWTKITKTIPGASSLQFDTNNEAGLEFRFYLFRGTDNTDNSVNLNQWETHSGTANSPDQTSTWYTTNDATFEITGVQLEVGEVATAFQFKTFDEVRRECYRYFQKVRGGIGTCQSSSQVNGVLRYEPMRTDPSLSKHGTSAYQFGDMIDQGRSTTSTPTFFRNDGLFGHSCYSLTGFSGMTIGEAMRDEGAGGDAAFGLDAEL
tara:strand:- start:3 stop:1133 length:1131 start_codon:yes stop_codon:yes gene_type:complete